MMKISLEERMSPVKDFDLYYWKKIEEFKVKDINIDGALERIPNYPKEKSVRKAYYRHYIRQLYDNGNFNSSLLEACCMNIKDVNILVKLLDLKFSHSLYIKVDKDILNLFVKFLSTQYSNKQILTFLSSDGLNNDENMFEDTLDEFRYSIDIIKSKFRKVSCKLQALHDEFVRCSKEERYKYMQDQYLEYRKEDLNPCIEINTYHVKLPKNGKELFDWAEELHNCMAGYFDNIKNNETIIYCFLQKDALAFAVEISDKKVVQSSGKYNANLTVEEDIVLLDWFEKFFKEDQLVLDCLVKTYM